MWQQILTHIREHDENIVQPWFNSLEAVQLDNGVLEIQAASQLHREYLQKQAREAFARAAQIITGRLVGVRFVNGQDEAAEPSDRLTQSALYTVPKNDYTFDSFVVGRSNRLAHAACVAVSESPGQAYNPLFIHGSAGLGKTHLMQAVCQEVLRRDPAAQVLFLTCETFIHHFIEGVEKGDLHNFRYRYRHVDVLVIDDIHFLADREASQEEFFHTFNTLYQSRKQIILSSDSAPSQIPSLEERLTSRFNWGLVARIDRPAYETRVAIVHKKAHLRGLVVPNDVICLIATKIDSNTRELEGALTKVAGWAAINGGSITLELAKQALAESDVGPTQEISIQQIFDAVTSRFGVRLADLQGKRRTKSIVYPRQICMHLARRLTRHSLEEIGGYFGGRDHTTVLHAVRTIDQHRSYDAHLQALLEEICHNLGAAGLEQGQHSAEVSG
jgi:chromosomal replication initiator protein